MSRKKEKSPSRLVEIRNVLRKHGITRGISPQKLRLILEDLGPTYIKIGQIMSMHSDILPKRYCDELMKLRSDVSPMPFSDVEEQLSLAYNCPWQKIFKSIEETTLGSASIAQVHRATLLTGEEVVIKVQRKGIYDTMAKDIALLHKLVRLMPPVSLKGLADFDQVLDEFWKVTCDEMNFQMEASNMQDFAMYNKDIAFVSTPTLYHEYTTPYTLVMEYIDGYSIDEKDVLLEEGYDLEEIGSKLVDNYIKQVVDDGFFHADPHSGNVKIRDGKIIWIDMGMMGRLSRRDQAELEKAIKGIAMHDIGMIEDAVMALGEFREKPDQSRLYGDILGLVNKYASQGMGDINIPEVMVALMEVMKENKISMPHGLTMLARGLTNMEGVLADICPEINMTQIAVAHISESMWEQIDWKKQLKKESKNIFISMKRATELPPLMADFLNGCMKGQTKMNLDIHISRGSARLFRWLVRNIVMGLWVMALLISSSIICTTNMNPKILGIPALGVIGYLMAFSLMMYIFIRHIFTRKK